MAVWRKYDEIPARLLKSAPGFVIFDRKPPLLSSAANPICEETVNNFIRMKPLYQNGMARKPCRLLLFAVQDPYGIHNADHRNTRICKNSHPHICHPGQPEHHDERLDCQRKYNILPCNAPGYPCNFKRLWDCIHRRSHKNNICRGDGQRR